MTQRWRHSRAALHLVSAVQGAAASPATGRASPDIDDGAVATSLAPAGGPPLDAAERAPEGREHRVGAALGRVDLVRVDQQQPLVEFEASTILLESGGHSRIPPPAVGCDLVARDHDLGTELSRRLGHHGSGIAAANEQAAAAQVQRTVELGERAAQVPGAGWSAARQQPVVQHEEGHDSAASNGSDEGRVVLEPQVSPEPEQDGTGVVNLGHIHGEHCTTP